MRYVLAPEAIQDLPLEEVRDRWGDRRSPLKSVLTPDRIPEGVSTETTPSRHRGFFRVLLERESLGREGPQDPAPGSRSFFSWLLSREKLGFNDEHPQETESDSSLRS